MRCTKCGACEGIRDMSETIFKVTGMDCAEETNALRQTVGALSGITDVTFNLLNGTMTVTAAEGAVDDRDIIAAVERAGMSARPADNAQAGVSPSRCRGILADAWPRRPVRGQRHRRCRGFSFPLVFAREPPRCPRGGRTKRIPCIPGGIHRALSCRGDCGRMVHLSRRPWLRSAASART